MSACRILCLFSQFPQKYSTGRYSPFPKSVKNINDYSEKKVQTLLDYAQACSSRDYLMLRILWRTGMRISELLSIRPQDLEAHNQVVNITKAKGN